MLKRLIVKNILLAFFCCLPLLGFTNSYLSDIEYSSASMGATSLDMSLKDDTNQPLTSTSFINLRPGATRNRIMYVTKDGSLDYQYQFSVSNFTGDSALCQALNIEAQYKQGSHYVTRYNGSLTSLALPDPLPINIGSDKWQLIFSLPTNADHSVQMMDCGFEFVVTAWQVDSNGIWGFFDSEKVAFSADSDDWTAPSSQVSALNQYYTQLPVTIPFTASDQFGKVNSVALWYRFGGNGAYSLLGTKTYSSQTVTDSFSFNQNKGDGKYEFYTIATDNAATQNTESVPASAEASFILDTHDPSTNLNVDNEVSGKSTIDFDGNTTLTFTATDTGGNPASGVDKTYYSIDSGASTEVSRSTALAVGALNLPTGDHTLYYNSADKAGNIEDKHHIHYSYVRPSETVVINEVMWMGSASDGDDEWIELRNMINQPIDIGGWIIENAKNGNADYIIPNNVNHIIPANGYYLITRRNANQSAISASIIANQYNGSLDFIDSGVQLFLKDSSRSHNIIDQTVRGVWPAGNKVTEHQSMERNSTPGDGTYSGSWHTCTDEVCNDNTYWKTPNNGHNYGTPGSVNHSDNDPTAGKLQSEVTVMDAILPVTPEATSSQKQPEEISLIASDNQNSIISTIVDEKIIYV